MFNRAPTASAIINPPPVIVSAPYVNFTGATPGPYTLSFDVNWTNGVPTKQTLLVFYSDFAGINGNYTTFLAAPGVTTKAFSVLISFSISIGLGPLIYIGAGFPGAGSPLRIRLSHQNDTGLFSSPRSVYVTQQIGF